MPRRLPAPALRRIAVALTGVAGLVMLDVTAKQWAASELRPRGPRVLVEEHLALRYQENPGAVFGLLRKAPEPTRTALFVATSVTAALITGGLLVRRLGRRAPGFLLPLGLGSLLAGILGNLHCRLDRGWVIDFIDWRVLGRWKWPVFNLADVCISVGIATCLIHVGIALVRSARQPDEDDDTPAGEATAPARPAEEPPPATGSHR